MKNAQRSDERGIVDEYFAIMAELDLRFANVKKKYHLCPDRSCRRLRRCAGEGMPCRRNPMPQPISNNDMWRVHRAFQRARRSRRRWW